MNSTHKILTFSIPLTASNFEQANQFSVKQLDPRKKKEVFLNTLAVQVVNYYCQCLGVKTEINQGDSWNWVNQSFFNVADLTLSKSDDLKLECRPILPDEDYCNIPLEVQGNRVAYLIVEINEQAKQGSILGFTTQINQGKLYRSQLQSLENFIIFMRRFSLPTKEYLEELLQKEKWQNLEEISASNYRRRLVSQSINQQKLSKAQIIKIEQRQVVLVLNLSWESFPTINLSIRINPQTLKKKEPKSLPLGLTVMLVNSNGLILAEQVTQEGDNVLSLGCELPTNHQITIKLLSSQGEIIETEIGLLA